MDLDCELADLIQVDPGNMLVKSREGSRLEFKESFNLANSALYARTMASFSNAKGGFIAFGVSLHVGVFFVMHVGPFTWVTLAFYAALLDPEETSRIAPSPRQGPPPRPPLSAPGPADPPPRRPPRALPARRLRRPSGVAKLGRGAWPAAAPAAGRGLHLISP